MQSTNLTKHSYLESIIKSFQNSTVKKQTAQLGSRQKDTNTSLKYFFISNKYGWQVMKIFLTLFIIKEMQIKTMMNYHYASI